MDILTESTITVTDEGAEMALEGLDHQGRYRITWVGDEATISWRTTTGKHERVDRITNIAVTDGKKDGEKTFTGISEKLVDRVRLSPDEAVIMFSVSGTDGCPTCH